MRLSRLFFRVALALLPVAVIGTVWLYLYPMFRSCAFPTPPSSYAQSKAPFRLLSLGDPQLEGDSSLPDPNALVFPSVERFVPHLRNASSMIERRQLVVQAGQGLVQDAGRWLEGKRKAIDLWGNDRYLAHIVRSLRWWSEPTHVSVLGDLLGSQWITDGEFRKRAGRYWDIVMNGLENVPQDVFGVDESEMGNAVLADSAAGSPGETRSEDEHGGLEDNAESVDAATAGHQLTEQKNGEVAGSKPERKKRWGGTTEVLGADPRWKERVINIAGNHDVGYAGDIDESRIDRFERAFGSVNWNIWFTLPKHLLSNQTSDSPAPALRLVVLNSMNLDTPAWAPELQGETYAFVNHIITTSRPVTDKTHATVLLTHIPLEKEAGLCVDSPYFDFFEGGQGVKEQNMLSDHSSKIVFEGMFGMSANKDAAGGGLGRKGIVVNGHDHAGCDVVHYIRQPGVEYTCNKDEIKSEEAYWVTSIVPSERAPNQSTTADLFDVSAVSANETKLETDREREAGGEASRHSEEANAGESGTDALPQWQARGFPPRPYDVNEKHECMAIREAPHLREITLRSMMGEYAGYAGFLSGWFDETVGEKGEWVFGFSTCGLGVQHWWWGVHILDLVLVVSIVAGCAVKTYETLVTQTPPSRTESGSKSSNLLKAEDGPLRMTKCTQETGTRENEPTVSVAKPHAA